MVDRLQSLPALRVGQPSMGRAGVLGLAAEVHVVDGAVSFRK